jgi:hypothetical protein
MSVALIKKENVGKIAERIVANELESRGFQVRDLNLEGLAANVDLLAVDKNGNMWQIQVKGSCFDAQYENGWWFHYGYCKEEHIHNSKAAMFNRSSGTFRANIVVLVCVKSPKEYQCIVLPIDIAEAAAQINLEYAYRTKKQDGTNKKPSMVWTAFYIPKTTPEKHEQMKREQDLLQPYIEKWDFDSDLSVGVL